VSPTVGSSGGRRGKEAAGRRDTDVGRLSGDYRPPDAPN
jgi:hypothetical protein